MRVLLLFLIYVSNKYGNAYLEINVPDNKYALDLDLFERVLDPELCEEQMNYMMRNETTLLIEFLDAGIRTPRGVFTGNLKDLGNYYQCLGIDQQIPNSIVKGKYCMIHVPLNQDIDFPSFPSLPEWPEWPEFPWPEFPWPELNPNTTRIRPQVLKRLVEYNAMKSGVQTLTGSKGDNRLADTSFSALSFNLAICIPRVCSTQLAISSLFKTDIDIQFDDKFCRLPNDKHWVPGDFVAIVIFSLIAILTIMSTSYDLHYHVYRHGDPKKVNKLYQSFSVYTNTRRLVTYTPVPGAIECLDGIRSFAMMWVIVGHTFATQLSSEIMANPLDAFDWMTSLTSVWITATPITVDTFFMLSGLLVVYTTAGKLTGMKLIKNIHLFYLNRLLRMFPVLAAMILIQVSFLNWITDGPYWTVPMTRIHTCRVYWWSTLLHIQNYVNPSNMCLGHTWYLAIDVQLYMLSPIVLFWVLSGNRRAAWAALLGSFLAVLAAATAFNFVMKFPPSSVTPGRGDEQSDYLTLYYVNTLTRGSPFFVGMLFGHLLHVYRGKKLVLHKVTVSLLWVSSAVLGGLIVYSVHPVAQWDWDNQLVDGLINSFMRPAWTAAVGWLVFACQHGYGGPVNWVLSLSAWKILGRLSYAMYIVHYPLQFVVNAMPVALVFFNVQLSILKFLADFTLAAIVAFILTVVIDAPFSTLVKFFIGGGPRKPPVNVVDVAKDTSIKD